MRGVLSGAYRTPNPGAGSSRPKAAFSRSMSLYRAGLALAAFLPLGVAMAAEAALGSTDVSPVIHFTLSGEGDPC